MLNPISLNRVYFLAYTLIWVILFFIQMSIDFFAFNMPAWFAFTDSIVSNLLFFILGMILWFPIRFMSVSGKKFVTVIINHILISLIFLGIWLIITNGVSMFIFNEYIEIQNFIRSGIYFRAIFAGLIFILLMVVYYLIIYNENLKLKISTEANLKTLVREAELNALKAQINPHFLFNSLNSISSLTISDPHKARKMIIELSEFLRYSLKHKEIELTSLDEEIQNIQRYMNIERIRFGEKLIFNSDIQHECQSFLVPNMILQPLFENAIKHGVYESITPVKINMVCTSMNSELLIQISNNFEVEAGIRKGTGLGLRNIQNRLKIMYGRDDLMKYSRSEKIFSVTLRIPDMKQDAPIRD